MAGWKCTRKKSGQIKTTSFPWWWKIAQSSVFLCDLQHFFLHINLQASCSRPNRGALNIFWRRATCFCMQARHFELKFYTTKAFLLDGWTRGTELSQWLHSQSICPVPSPWWNLCWNENGFAWVLAFLLPWLTFPGLLGMVDLRCIGFLGQCTLLFQGSLGLWIYVVPGFPGMVAFQLGLFSICHEKPKLQIFHSFFRWLASEERWKSGTRWNFNLREFLD